jgi:hypothetical protein
MISVVPSSCWLMARDRISSSVTTPPALRMMCASPSFRPGIRDGCSLPSSPRPGIQILASPYEPVCIILIPRLSVAVIAEAVTRSGKTNIADPLVK